MLAKLLSKRSGQGERASAPPPPAAPRRAETPPAPAEPEPEPAYLREAPPWEDLPPPEGSLPHRPGAAMANAAPEPAPMPEPRPAPTLPPMTPPAAADTPPWEESAPAPRQPEPPAPLAQAAEPAAPPPAAAPVAPAPVSAPADADAAPLFSGNWGELIAGLRERLGAKEIMLAQNAELTGVRGNLFCLRAPPQFRFSATPEVQALLAQALSEALGAPVQLEVALGEISGETPFMQQQRLRGEALEAARERLQQDPVVTALVREFDATLRPDSIQPVQE